ncbi:MAG: bifunctional oligoribonuclease/PAP phosphatase NrnA [Anaerolineae bacterium]
MTKKSTLEQVSRLIRRAHQPLLVCHVAPDGDALGSLTGLAYALRRLDQSPIAACADNIPSRFRYIPNIEAVVRSFTDPFDLVVALDCSDLRRLGDFPELPHFNQCPLINIDHHVTNVGFGDVDLVDPGASSTAEVLLRLLEHLDVSLDERLATCLLVGIVTDTRGFRTNNVTPRVMETALRLMEAGASLPYVTQHGLDCRPTVVIRLWGAALSRLRSEDGVIWTSIPLGMRRGVGYHGDGDAGLVSFLVSAEEADVSVVFVEQGDGRVEVGMRAGPGFDVARFALRFGGGGHALAAGFSISGPLDAAEGRVLEALRADLARQRASHAQRNPQHR